MPFAGVGAPKLVPFLLEALKVFRFGLKKAESPPLFSLLIYDTLKMFPIVPKGLFVMLYKAPSLTQCRFCRVIVGVVAIELLTQGEVAVGRGSREHLARERFALFVRLLVCSLVG